MGIKKNLLITTIILLGVCNLYAVHLDVLPKPTIIEEIENYEYNLTSKNGLLWLYMNLVIDEKNYPTLFLLDTGAASSCLFMDGEIRESFDYENNGLKFCMCSAYGENFHIDNWFLFLDPHKRVYPNERYHGLENYILTGILGNDVLMHKSLYISPSKNKFSWSEENPLVNQPNCVSYTAWVFNGQKRDTDCTYFIYIDDDFLMSEDKGFEKSFLSKDGKKSRYMIDTGCYAINCTDDTVYYNIKLHRYKYFVYKDNVSYGTGSDYIIASIPSAEIFGMPFYKLKVTGGVLPKFFKTMGLQVLSAFDVYFAKEGHTRVQNIYFHPVSSELYNNYRKENDFCYYKESITYGFYTQNNNIVMRKAFYKGKELIPEVNVGDKIISVNNLLYKNMTLWEFPNQPEILFQRPDGSFYKIKVKRVSLD